MSKINNDKRKYPYYIDSDSAIAKLKDYCAKYDSKVHYIVLGQSLFTKIDRFLDRCIYPPENNIDYIPPDEIDIEIAATLFGEQNSIDDDYIKECVLLSTAFILRRKVNRFYNDVNKHSISIRRNKDYTIQEYEHKIRFDKNIKLVRGVK